MTRVVDLTHHLFNGMAVYPGIPDPSFTAIARVEDDGYAMTEYHLLNHIGTHIDAPAHQIAGGATLDEIPLDRLVTHAVTIDVSDLPKGAVTPYKGTTPAQFGVNSNEKASSSVSPRRCILRSRSTE